MATLRFKCGECGVVFAIDDEAAWPQDCPACKFHHCGDDQCCIGEPFQPVFDGRSVS